MKRRIFSLVFAAVAFAVTLNPGSAEARVFHWLRSRRPAYCKPVKQPSRRRLTTNTPSAFPPTLWDLGNNMGEWPPYYDD